MRYLHTGDKLYCKVGSEILEYTLLACDRNSSPMRLALEDVEGRRMSCSVDALGNILFVDKIALKVDIGQYLYYIDEKRKIKHCIVERRTNDSFVVRCENNKLYHVPFDLIGKTAFMNILDLPKPRRKIKLKTKAKLKVKRKFKKYKKQYRSKGIERDQNSIEATKILRETLFRRNASGKAAFSAPEQKNSFKDPGRMTEFSRSVSVKVRPDAKPLPQELYDPGFEYDGKPLQKEENWKKRRKKKK